MSSRAHRFPANFAVVLRQGAEMYPGTICNISSSGACLLGVEWMTKGEPMVLDYQFGQTRATVTWKAGKIAGVKFEDNLTESGLQFIRSSHSYAS